MIHCVSFSACKAHRDFPVLFRPTYDSKHLYDNGAYTHKTKNAKNSYCINNQNSSTQAFDLCYLTPDIMTAFWLTAMAKSLLDG